MRFRNSIALRYFLATAIVLIFGQLIFSVFALYMNFVVQREDLHQRAVAHVNFLSDVVPDNILANNFYPIENLMRRTASDEDFVYSIVTHMDGRVITTYLNGQDPHVQLAISGAEEPNTLSRVNYLSNLDGIVEVKSDVVTDDAIIGEVRLGYITDDLLARFRDNIITTLILSGALALILAIVTIVLFNFQIRKPIRELATLADQFAQGQLDKRSVPKGDTEISQLQKAFNNMAEQLQENIDDMERLSQVASRTNNAVIIANPVGEIEWVNDAFSTITGYTIDEVKGKSPGSILQGEKSDPDTVEFMRARIRKGEGFHAEIINYHKTGREYWIDIEVRPVYGDDGKIKSFIAIETDITQRKLSEARIRESEALKSGILETALDAIISIDSTGTIIEFNPSAERVFGHKRDNVLGRSFGELMIPEHLREAHREGLDNYLATGEAHVLGKRIEVTALHADGTEFPVELAITSLDYQDSPVFTAHLRDITERKASQESLEKFAKDMALANWELSIQKSRFQSLLGIATQVVDIQTQLEELLKSGMVSFGMQAACITQFVGGQFVVRASSTTGSGYHIPEVMMPGNPIHDKTFENETVITHNSIDVVSFLDEIIEIRSYIGVALSVNGNPYGTLCFLSDDLRLQDFTDSDYDFIQLMAEWISVTLEREIARDNLTSYAAELERSNRELQDFAYVASHDLQEPLRKIQAFGSRVESRYNNVLDERGVDYIQRIQNAANRMQNLINDLLSFSRVSSQAKAFRSVNLQTILNNVLSDLEVRIKESDANLVIQGDFPTIECESTHMQQLFLNLIGNAIKFKHPARTSEISVSSALKAEDSNVLEIEVADNGIGFDEKYSDKIFTIFEQLHDKNEYEGTGIGLAVCKRIVEHHSGTISVTSQENVGTTFHIELPVRQSN